MSVSTSIPAELRERRQWLTWNNVEGRKIPNGKSNDPTTWSDFASIEIFDNIAFVIAGDDPYTGIDLDGCRVDGDWTEWAKPILERFQGVAYCEVSPSGSGCKLTTKAKKPDGSRCTHKIGEGKQQIECYDHARFWTVTSNVVDGFETIGDGQEAVDWLCTTYLAGDTRKTGTKRTSTTGTSSLSLLQRAQAYSDKMAAAGVGDLRNAAFRNAGHLHAIVGDAGERLTDNDVYHLLRSWNARNTEPLRDDELLEAAINGRKNGTPPADKLPRESTDFAGDPDHDQQTKSDGQTTWSVAPFSAADLIRDYPEKRPRIIEGICRRGETMNIIGASKAGKTWFIHNMLLSVASGADWLGQEVTQGRVLLIDNELHPEELASRIRFVAERMGVSGDVLAEHVDILPLRGRLRNVGQIAGDLAPYADRKYSMIALDAFYRALPDGISENDNAAMAGVYNIIDKFAGSQDCTIVLNHHSSKGDQSGKAVTDVGSGAGSISRAVDAHLTLRSHELEDCAVLEGVFRSWPPMEPKTIRWNYPLWEATHIEAVLKRPESKQQANQAKADREADDRVIELLNGGTMAVGTLRAKTGYGQQRLDRCIARLEADEKVKRSRRRSRSTGKTKDVVKALEVASNDDF